MKVTICGRGAAIAIVQDLREAGRAGVLVRYPAIISIGGHPLFAHPHHPTTPAISTNWLGRYPGICLRQTYDDIPVPRPGWEPMAPSQAAELVRFAREHRAHEEWLIHCAAGLSRSPAAALVVAAARQDGAAPGAAAELAVRIVQAGLHESTEAGARMSEAVKPNPRVVVLGDRALDFDGALVDAAVRHGWLSREDVARATAGIS